ncbi:MAG: GH116 family glycosyl-hydrolase [Chloroflexota bacterium]|nr:GH116 family glycosyl-hydrolase [Chloroflexota bacterium]
MTRSSEVPQRRTYTGQALRCVAMPLGGIGTGSVALCGDGSLRQWQIFNQVNHEAFLPHSFFAIHATPAGSGARGQPMAKVLQSDALYDDQDLQPAPSISDHIVPEEARRLLDRLPDVEATEFAGEYPIAHVRYLDVELPLQVELEAYSPFIPLNPRESGLPAAVFTFAVKNTGQQALDVSLLATLQNGVGWDGLSPIGGVECPCPFFTPQDLRCFFVTAQGWGTFAQQIAEGRQIACSRQAACGRQADALEIAWGKLELRELSFAFEGVPAGVTASAEGQPLEVEWRHEAGQVRISLMEPVTLGAGDVLSVAILSE